MSQELGPQSSIQTLRVSNTEGLLASAQAMLSELFTKDPQEPLPAICYTIEAQPTWHIGLEFEPITEYLGSTLEGFAGHTVRFGFSRQVPRSLVEALSEVAQQLHFVCRTRFLYES